jgi:hypothetical protein
MAIGERRPITFKKLVEIPETGASLDEIYTVVGESFANVRQRRGNRTLLDNATGQEVDYIFSEIRQRDDFIPTKDMLINYNGRDLIITDIVLIDKDVPYYYTITAQDSK